MKKKKELQLVAVYWRDIHFRQDWHDDAEVARELPDFVTIGAKLKGGDPTVIAGCVSTGDSECRVADLTEIPKGCIVRTEVLGTVKLRKALKL